MNHKFGKLEKEVIEKNNILKLTKEQNYDFMNKRLTNIGEPLEYNDAVSKDYLDKEISYTNQFINTEQNKIQTILNQHEIAIQDNDEGIKENKKCCKEIHEIFSKYITGIEEKEIPFILNTKRFKNEKDLKITVVGNKCYIAGILVKIGEHINNEFFVICNFSSNTLFYDGFYSCCYVAGNHTMLILDKDSLRIQHKFDRNKTDEKIYINTVLTLY